MADPYPATCPFCKIAQMYPADHDSPVPSSPDPELLSPQCHLILSTPQVLAFLDIMPISQGHVLLIPRQHSEKLSDIPPTPAPPAPAQSRLTSLWQRPTPLHLQEGRNAAQALGFWMPLISRALSRTLEFEDWNIVQNNGVRAAQVVPHVHFHFIPRYTDDRIGNKRDGKVDVGMLKSWTMFGRGKREDLDDDEGREISEALREALREEIKKLTPEKAKL